MELSDTKTLDCLIGMMVGAQRRNKGRTRGPRMTDASVDLTPVYVPPAIKSRRTCRCGKCATCVDNARWEAIFQAKFADPNYYGRLTTRRDSPLNS